MKTCTKCGTTKPLDMFPKGKGHCKLCSNTYMREHARKKREALGLPRRRTVTQDLLLNDFKKSVWDKSIPTAIIEYDDGCMESALDTLRRFTQKERNEMGIKIENNIIKVF
jgi:hypothetical protein